MNEHQELFTDRRLLNEMKPLAAKEPQEIIEAIMKSVQTFSEKMPQSDDITLLALRYLGT